jgi:hypothetical protein
MPALVAGIHEKSRACEPKDFLILRAREARVSKDEEIRQRPKTRKARSRRSFETALRASSG